MVRRSWYAGNHYLSALGASVPPANGRDAESILWPGGREVVWFFLWRLGGNLGGAIQVGGMVPSLKGKGFGDGATGSKMKKGK